MFNEIQQAYEVLSEQEVYLCDSPPLTTMFSVETCPLGRALFPVKSLHYKTGVWHAWNLYWEDVQVQYIHVHVHVYYTYIYIYLENQLVCASMEWYFFCNAVSLFIFALSF